ncbi:ABC transporter substrate-binding protein [Cohnella rhizoplanae]|uniref:ABC transporter substrate-binding protein n=1 Tax=Cohnella rhizoplanae TaxID=2974897 RepID=UPI0022FF7570|nr:ABC transporter substrate-binding protein [Cohnella sp. JJ-181]CAI6085801.1 hypothetical protein COHCIP112018_04796 [Cohnella sp. JJ-181]
MRKKAFRKGKWGIALMMAMAFVVSGCGNNNNGSESQSSASASATGSPSQAASSPAASANADIDTSKEVTLKMVLLGAKPADFDEVYGEVNKRMKGKINATLDVSFIDWGEYEQKYPLLFAASEDIDLAFSANWNKYSQIATKNGYLELTEEMLQKYAPQTWEKEPKVAWEQAKVNGKVYMVPQDQFEYEHKLVAIRGDLREKYGIPEIKTLDDYHSFLATISSKDKSIIPSMGAGEGSWLDFTQPNEFYHLSYPLPIVYKITDASGKLMSYADTPEYTQYIERMYKAAQAGAWQKDAIVSKLDRKQAFIDGKLASLEWNIGTLTTTKVSIANAHPDWKIEIVDLSADKKRLLLPYIGNGMSVAASSKNPERALMALDLLRYDQEIHDLTNYGIEGKHYEKVGDDQFKSLEASANFPAMSVCPWGWNSLNERTDVTIADERNAIMEQFKANTVNHPLQMFVFDDSAVKNEEAAINNIMDTYGKPLRFGLVEPNDPKRGVKAFQEKLKVAGIEKVIAEMQKQADAFLQAQS